MSESDSTYKPFNPSARHARLVNQELARLYPDARCALDYRNLFELIVATILSAQCTDKRVNMVTPGLFARYPDAKSLARADLDEVENLIHSTGYYKAKSRSIVGMALALWLDHAGKVPHNLDKLTKLLGVGRKTANVVLGVGCGISSGIVVDTHVTRLSQRLGLTKQTTALQIERELVKVIPKSDWVLFSLRMIDHGRAVCKAGRPACHRCELSPICPKIGVEPTVRKSSANSKKSESGISLYDSVIVKASSPPKKRSGVAKTSQIETISESHGPTQTNNGKRTKAPRGN